MNIAQTEDDIVITISKQQNKTLEELKQETINLLFENVGNLELYSKQIELLEILLKQKD